MLTVIENRRLEELEGVIAKGLKNFYDVGCALMEIRDSRLYQREHLTFEAYCKKRWAMTRRHANHLIGSAKVVDALGTMVPVPASERQVRPLTAIKEPEKQAEVWRQAIETADVVVHHDTYGDPPAIRCLCRRCHDEEHNRPRPPKKQRLISFPASIHEHEIVQAAAAVKGVSVAKYARDIVLPDAASTLKQAKQDAAGAVGKVFNPPEGPSQE